MLGFGECWDEREPEFGTGTSIARRQRGLLPEILDLNESLGIEDV